MFGQLAVIATVVLCKNCDLFDAVLQEFFVYCWHLASLFVFEFRGEFFHLVLDL